MCFTRKERDDLEKEAPRITQSRLLEEEARHRHEEQHRRSEQEKIRQPYDDMMPAKEALLHGPYVPSHDPFLAQLRRIPDLLAVP
jgi:hypothetical protein